MPGPAILGFYGTLISIDKKDVHKVRIFVEQDGNGAIEVPYNGTMTVLRVPGSALCVLSTLKAHGLGFQMRVSGSSVSEFITLFA
jgi:hypothetical protein